MKERVTFVYCTTNTINVSFAYWHVHNSRTCMLFTKVASKFALSVRIFSGPAVYLLVCSFLSTNVICILLVGVWIPRICIINLVKTVRTFAYFFSTRIHFERLKLGDEVKLTVFKCCCLCCDSTYFFCYSTSSVKVCIVVIFIYSQLAILDNSCTHVI